MLLYIFGPFWGDFCPFFVAFLRDFRGYFVTFCDFCEVNCAWVTASVCVLLVSQQSPSFTACEF